MDLGFAGANTVVQGGTQGMGRATAECFAAEGANVAVLARTQADLDATVARLLELGAPDAVGLRADITNGADVVAAFAQLSERWGSVNALVNAAGPTSIGSFEELSDEDWHATLEIGAMGMVRCVRAALPLIRKADWGRIVNISAHSTKRQSDILVAYTAAKAVVTSVTKNLSLALAKEEILVNTISPGTFATPAVKEWAESAGVDSSDLYALMAGIDQHFGTPAQMPRAGDPVEIAAVIAFVASRRNTYMTGADLNVDGGSDFT